ncbi:unnamed protein product [Phytophthora lilii]|uniref:Unnamed protein product n=1 Tax=Phytophthora lilii TaxID=2077276 RepID=A0A9W6XFL1_9STRA|nr:unnamed protein product [Phytophthora lilii]
MLGIKPFVQESVQALPPAQLRLLAETLRIDLRGCDDRGDIERVLTGLVCLDQDTSLGVFLTWLRSADLQQHKNGILASKKPKFSNTFLPALSEVRSTTNQQSKPELNERVKDHHLDDEIKQQLTELEVLETSFKKAERLVHTGSPSFEKLKQFLFELTILRAKEQTARAFLVRQANVLREQHDEMRAEMLHSRAQLDFFVEGFTNLRKRHDALLVDATRMKAENETAQEVFVSMSAHDCYFEQLMRNTLCQQMRDNEELKRRLQQAHDDLDAAAQKRKELEAQISQLKQQRGDARKDAYCYKRQLRVCKSRMRKLQQAGGGVDGSFFRSQAVALRQTVATLLGLLRDAIVRDTKSPKQTLSKEALRILGQVLTPSIGTVSDEVVSQHSFRNNQEEPESEDLDPAQPRVVQRNTSLDVDEVIRGVLLVEGATPTDAAECARIMGEKLRYLPVDLKQTLAQLQQDEENRAQAAREEEQKQLQELLEQQQHSQQAEGQGTDGRSDLSTAASTLAAKLAPQTPAQTNTPAALAVARPAPTIEAYAGALKKHVTNLMELQGKRGFVMFNWAFSRRDVNMLTAIGLPVDSVINLEVVGAPQPPPTSSTANAASTSLVGTVPPTPATPAKPKTPATVTKAVTPSSSNSTRGKAPAPSPAARGKTSPTKAAAPSKSPAKSVSRTAAPTPGAKPRAASPTRAAASPRKPTSSVSASPLKPRTPTVPSTPAKPGSSASQLKPKTTEGVKVVKKAPTAASALHGLGGLLQPVGPASFPAERVNAIVQVLEQQKRRKLAPVVHWDEATRRTNEMLAMWAEEPHQVLGGVPEESYQSVHDQQQQNLQAKSCQRPSHLANERQANFNFNDKSSPTEKVAHSNINNCSWSFHLKPIRRICFIHLASFSPYCFKQFNVTGLNVLNNQTATSSPAAMKAPAGIDAGVFAALPRDIQDELRAQAQAHTLQDAQDSQDQQDQDQDAQDAPAWSCRVCTFLNHPQLVECELCGSLCVDLQDEQDEQDAGPAAGSRLARTLRRLRVPATPAAVSFSQKREPTAEDLLLAATSRLQAAAASWPGRRSRTNSADARPQGLPSLQALRELTALQKDLTRKVAAGDSGFESSLERLWRAVQDRQDQDQFCRTQVDWVALGFQNASPETDFRGGGVLALKCLLYAFEAHPKEMRAIHKEQEPDAQDGSHKKRWYPVCVAGINLTCLLAGLLQLGDGHFAERKEVFWPLFEEPAAFYELFFLGKCHGIRNEKLMLTILLLPAFIKMDAIWHRLNATYMEFGGIN